MRKSLLVVLAFLLAVTGAFAQNGAERRAAYNRLEQERQELLAWEGRHPGAPKLVAMYKNKKAREIRARQYKEFFDFKRQEIGRFKENLRQDLRRAKNVPFVTFNALPAKNLAIIAKNKELLTDILKNYPDNAVTLTDAYLTKLFQEDEGLERLVRAYAAYLHTYNANPAAAADFSPSQREQLTVLQKNGNRAALYTSLSQFSSEAVKRQKENLARKYAAHTLKAAFSK